SSYFTSLSTEGHLFSYLTDQEPTVNIFYQGTRHYPETRNSFGPYPDVNDFVNSFVNRNCLLHNVVDIPRSQYSCHSEKMENLPDRSFWRHKIPIHSAKRRNDHQNFEMEEADHLMEPSLLNTNGCVSVISKTDREDVLVNDDNYNLKTGTNDIHEYKVRRKKVYIENTNMYNYDHCGKRNFACHQCNYKTDRKNNLKRHITTMHSDCNRNLECCDVTFKCKATLREHVRSLHSTGYRCKVCERNFCRKALLRRHLTVHNGQKDFQCALCDYATSHKSNLERHQKVHDKSLKSDEYSSKWRTVRCILLLQKQKHLAYARKITGESSIYIDRDDIQKADVHSNETLKEVPKLAYKEPNEKAAKCISHMESIESNEDSHVEKSDIQVKRLMSNLYENMPPRESYDDNSHIPSHDCNSFKTPMNEHKRQTFSKSFITSTARQTRLCLNPYHCAECNSSFSKQRALYSHDCKGYVHLSSYSVVSIFRKWIQSRSQHIVSTI
ncbi:hypothetical protein CHS0354_004365, partial [Potamilus streckersoni]